MHAPFPLLIGSHDALTPPARLFLCIMNTGWQLALTALAHVVLWVWYSLAPHFPLETGQSDQNSGSCLPTSLPLSSTNYPFNSPKPTGPKSSSGCQGR